MSKEEIKLTAKQKLDKKIAERKTKIVNTIREIVLYLTTVFGVMMSPFIPSLLQIIIYNKIPVFEASWHPIRIGVILFVALLMTFAIERKGDKAGKMKNFKKRMLTHLAYGAMWHAVLESVIKGIAG